MARSDLYIKIPIEYFLIREVLDYRTNDYVKAEKIIKEIKVKDNYTEIHPTDYLGNNIDDSLTYYDIYVGMANGKDIYEMLNVSDSLVRERVFMSLSELMDVDYIFIYYLWLNN